MQAPDQVLKTRDGEWTVILWNDQTAQVRHHSRSGFDSDETNRGPLFKTAAWLTAHNYEFTDLDRS